MSHSVFQTAQIMPINTQIIPSSKPHLSSKPLLPPSLCRPSLFAGKVRKTNVVIIKATASPAVDGDPMAVLERCFQASPSLDSPASSSVMYAPVMKGGKYGAFGATTLEKSKLDLTQQKQTRSSPEVCCVFTLNFPFLSSKFVAPADW